MNLDRYDDREDIRTNLIDSFDRFVNFVCRHTDDKFFLDEMQRDNVRGIIASEIVGNLLMYREYSSGQLYSVSEKPDYCQRF